MKISIKLIHLNKKILTYNIKFGTACEKKITTNSNKIAIFCLSKYLNITFECITIIQGFKYILVDNLKI